MTNAATPIAPLPTPGSLNATHRAPRLPAGFGISLAVVVSIGLWVGLAQTAMAFAI